VRVVEWHTGWTAKTADIVELELTTYM